RGHDAPAFSSLYAALPFVPAERTRKSNDQHVSDLRGLRDDEQRKQLEAAENPGSGCKHSSLSRSLEDESGHEQFPPQHQRRCGKRDIEQVAKKADHGKVAKRVFRVSGGPAPPLDRKSTRLNSSHVKISYAVFCLKKKRSTSMQT